MKKFWCAIFLLIFAANSHARVADTISFQGRFLIGPGSPLINHPLKIRFSLWPDADFVDGTDRVDGNLVGANWEEVQNISTDDRGYFAVEIGIVTPLPEIFDVDLHKFLQAEVRAVGATDADYIILDPLKGNETIDRKSITESVYAQNAARLDGRKPGFEAGDIPYLDENGKLNSDLISEKNWLDPVANLDELNNLNLTEIENGSIVFVILEKSLYVLENSNWKKIGINISFDELTNSFNFGNNKLTNIADPESDQDAATKSYVDAVISSGGGSGGKFVGVTTNKNFDGNFGGYLNADAACRVDFSGSHVCRTDEILATISAGNIDTVFNYTDLKGAWILEGPPGYIAPANDCNGLMENSFFYLGAFWQFDASTGGRGKLSLCSQKKPLACCK